MNDICKSCHRQIPKNSIYCNWCGCKQISDVNEVPVPKPRKQKAGYGAQVMIDGQRVWIHGMTEAEYYKKAREAKIKKDNLPVLHKSKDKLSEVICNYIEKNSKVLSPASIRGYHIIRRNRFTDYMDKYIDTIDYQEMINNEVGKCSAKTIKSSWGLVKAALNDYGCTVPKVHLPPVAPKEQNFLNVEQLKKFLQVIHGNPYEVIYLLGIHSLRLSEIKSVRVEDVTENGIKVSGAIVPNEFNKQVYKETNKNSNSTRTVPILIPRLLEIKDSITDAQPQHEQTWRKHLARICKDNDLPILSIHDLRRTFATVAYSAGVSERTLCQLAGWTVNSQTVHKIYVQLTQAQIDEDVAKLQKVIR